MAVVHEHDDGDGGSSAAVVAIFLIALIVILAILFYGFAVAHWFGAGGGNTTISGAATLASASNPVDIQNSGAALINFAGGATVTKTTTGGAGVSGRPRWPANELLLRHCKRDPVAALERRGPGWARVRYQGRAPRKREYFPEAPW